MEINKIKDAMLFKNMTEEEISQACRALSCYEENFEKGSLIYSAGDQTDRLGIVLSGSVTIESNDLWGQRTVLSHVGAGQVFAETYALLPDQVMLVDVTANEDCRIAFLKTDRLQDALPLSAGWARHLLFNLLNITAKKNLLLSSRSFHTAPKAARDRIMSYLNTVSLQNNSKSFDIPFDRQQMADYLNLDRTALSRELGRMKKEGLIDFRRNHFILLTAAF